LPAFTPVANEAQAVGDSGECVVPSGRTPRSARGDRAETEREQGEKGVFHRAFGEKKLYHLVSW